MPILGEKNQRLGLNQEASVRAELPRLLPGRLGRKQHAHQKQTPD